jgi:hypothetical protein
MNITEKLTFKDGPLAIWGMLQSKLPDSLIAYIRGAALINSFAEGFANSSSDVDVFLLMEDGFDERGGAEHWEQYNFDGTTVDVLFLNETLILDRFVRATELPLDLGMINFIHKMRTARPIFNAAEFIGINSGFDWAAFDDRLSLFYLSLAGPCMSDVFGNISECDWNSAIVNARRLVRNGVDSYLAKIGQSQSREKWRVKKARRGFSDDAELFSMYTTVECGFGVEEGENSLPWILDSLRYFRYICARINFPDFSCAYNANDTKRGWVVPAFSQIVKSGNHYIFHNPTPELSLSYSMALLWNVMQFSVDNADLMKNYMLSHLERKPISMNDLSKAISGFYDKGMLREAKDDM